MVNENSKDLKLKVSLDDMKLEVPPDFYSC
jgi:hypothetical protein